MEFIPISVSTLLPTEAVGLDLFQMKEDSERLVLYRRSHFPLSLEDLDRLRGRGVKQLFISQESRQSYQNYLKKLTTTGFGRKLSFKTRFGAVNEVIRDVMQTSFELTNVSDTVAAVDKLSKMATETILEDDFCAHDMFDVLHHDFTTFTHSTNVAFYCGVLAEELGLKRADIQQIITGGLLHDLGKLEIDTKILNKPAKLDDREFNCIKSHPVVGFRRLADRDDLSWGQLMMVYQHHEKIDGTGYPVGCVESDIHLWAKICAVVDVFEALTSKRPYREPMSRRRALRLMQRDSGTHFDSEVLQCWTQIIQESIQK